MVANFYSQSMDAQAAGYQALARAALPAWRLEGACLRLLKNRENAVFAVNAADGRRFAMRIHRAGYHSDNELRSELEWMAALDAAGVHTPPVIHTADGAMLQTVSCEPVPEPRQVDLLGWVDGAPMGSIEEGIEIELDVLLTNYQQIGALAARLHNQASSWVLPEGFSRHRWDLDGLVGEAPVWGRFWEHEAFDPSERNMALKARALLKEVLSTLDKTPDCYGLIHADFLPENLLVDGDRINLIDFDDSGFGWHLFELATSLFVHLGEPYFDQVLAALVSGYRAERPLPDEQLDLLPYFLLARLTTYVGWLHTHEAVAGTEEMAPLILGGMIALTEELLANQGA